MRAKANVNARDRFLSTPLHYAAGNGFVDIVKVLPALSLFIARCVVGNHGDAFFWPVLMPSYLLFPYVYNHIL